MNEHDITLTYTQADGIRIRIQAHLLSDVRILLGDIGNVYPDLVCSVCESELSHIEMQEDDGKSYDLYGCRECNSAVTYVTPTGYHEYHEAIVNGVLEIEVDISEA